MCTFNSVIKGVPGTRLSTRLVSYGTIYNVGFNRKQKPTTPAEKYASTFTTNVKMEPVSIGTTGLDAILSFLEAHKGEKDAVVRTGSESVAKEILELSELLYASEDNYDTRTNAADIIYAHNIQPLTGGTSWHFDGKAPPGGAPALPLRSCDTGWKWKDTSGLLNGRSRLEISSRLCKSQVATRKVVAIRSFVESRV